MSETLQLVKPHSSATCGQSWPKKFSFTWTHLRILVKITHGHVLIQALVVGQAWMLENNKVHPIKNDPTQKHSLVIETCSEYPIRNKGNQWRHWACDALSKNQYRNESGSCPTARHPNWMCVTWSNWCSTMTQSCPKTPSLSSVVWSWLDISLVWKWGNWQPLVGPNGTRPPSCRRRLRARITGKFLAQPPLKHSDVPLKPLTRCWDFLSAIPPGNSQHFHVVWRQSQMFSSAFSLRDK